MTRAYATQTTLCIGTYSEGWSASKLSTALLQSCETHCICMLLGSVSMSSCRISASWIWYRAWLACHQNPDTACDCAVVAAWLELPWPCPPLHLLQCCQQPQAQVRCRLCRAAQPGAAPQGSTTVLLRLSSPAIPSLTPLSLAVPSSSSKKSEQNMTSRPDHLNPQ